MSKKICELNGVRGRILKVYDNKIVIVVQKTFGSFITSSINNGEKTLYFSDIIGVQFKKSGLLIGYLQFETASTQANHNFFSENSFAFQEGIGGITNQFMAMLYTYITNRIEEIKYNLPSVCEAPIFTPSTTAVKKNTLPLIILLGFIILGILAGIGDSSAAYLDVGIGGDDDGILDFLVWLLIGGGLGSLGFFYY